jgi:alkylhydroperoxidase family enzyme
MKIALPPKLQKLVDAFLGGAGDTTRDLRRRVMERVDALSGGPAGGGDLPDDLAPYVRKIALHAYRVTDEDIAALEAAGYTEDAIFEITAAAAISAGVTRMERGLSALRAAPRRSTTEDADAPANS